MMQHVVYGESQVNNPFEGLSDPIVVRVMDTANIQPVFNKVITFRNFWPLREMPARPGAKATSPAPPSTPLPPAFSAGEELRKPSSRVPVFP